MSDVTARLAEIRERRERARTSWNPRDGYSLSDMCNSSADVPLLLAAVEAALKLYPGLVQYSAFTDALTQTTEETTG